MIGEGGMGSVYQAKDRLTNEIVALKQVQVPSEDLDFFSKPDTESERSLRIALTQEFQILAGLRHPHIISVLDFGFDTEQQPFFTMTYLPEAQTILEAGQNIDEAGKVGLVRQMLQALTYLHRRGIIHRDLKPNNVLVSQQTLRLLDFGLSTSHGLNNVSSGGTLLYMAPELLRREAASEASDLYAVGVMAYELFAGQHPFDITSGKFAKQVQHDPPDLSRLNTTDAIAAFIGCLLAKPPKDRYPQA